MLDDKKSIFELNIPDGADGLIRIDTIKAIKGQ